jgi:phage-related protein
MATWPTADSFPQKPLIGGNTEAPPNTIIRTSMDVGPAKLRQRSTAGSGTYHFNFHMTDANIIALRTFYITTCHGGADSFEWVDPRTSATEDWRFLGQPSWVQIKNNLYHVSVDLEQLP